MAPMSVQRDGTDDDVRPDRHDGVSFLLAVILDCTRINLRNLINWNRMFGRCLFSSLFALRWSASEDSDPHRHPTR